MAPTASGTEPAREPVDSPLQSTLEVSDTETSKPFTTTTLRALDSNPLESDTV